MYQLFSKILKLRSFLKDNMVLPLKMIVTYQKIFKMALLWFVMSHRNQGSTIRVERYNLKIDFSNVALMKVSNR